MDLLQKMVSGTPQFVRCIKPNDVKAPKCFEATKVIKQLRYTGVLETIRIRQHGFSHRLLFSDFLKRYCFLAYAYDERVVASRESCRLLLIRLKMDGWALGKSKVFLKYYHVEFLSKLYEDQIKKIVLVQSFIRRFLAKVHFKKLKIEKELNVLTLQKHVRGWLTRRRFQLMRDKQIREKIEKDRKEKQNQMQNQNHVVMQQFVSRSALLRKLEAEEEKQDKENHAAVVIQTCEWKIAVHNKVKNVWFLSFFVQISAGTRCESKSFRLKMKRKSKLFWTQPRPDQRLRKCCWEKSSKKKTLLGLFKSISGKTRSHFEAFESLKTLNQFQAWFPWKSHTYFSDAFTRYDTVI